MVLTAKNRYLYCFNNSKICC